MEKAKLRLSVAIALIISVLTGFIVTFFCLPKSAVFAEEEFNPYEISDDYKLVEEGDYVDKLYIKHINNQLLDYLFLNGNYVGRACAYSVARLTNDTYDKVLVVSVVSKNSSPDLYFALVDTEYYNSFFTHSETVINKREQEISDRNALSNGILKNVMPSKYVDPIYINYYDKFVFDFGDKYQLLSFNDYSTLYENSLSDSSELSMCNAIKNLLYVNKKSSLEKGTNNTGNKSPLSGFYSKVSKDFTNIDGDFDKTEYPVIEDDYSLQFVSAAINDRNELLVYFYQPTSDINILATSINIDKYTNASNTQNYKLQYIDNDGVFFKYKVNDFKIAQSSSNQTIQIVSVFRKFLNNIDKDGTQYVINNIKEVVYPVAKQCTFQNGVIVDCRDIEVITITSKYVGFIIYNNGLKTYFLKAGGDVDYKFSYFVAFSTDKKIDKLLKARVSYDEFSFEETYSVFGEHFNPDSVKKGVVENKTKDLSYSKVITSEINGKNYSKYSFNEIQTVDEFLSTEKVVDESEVYFFSLKRDRLSKAACNELKDKKFVLRFCSQDIHQKFGPVRYVVSGKLVENVSILTLEFETNGVRFKMNCIDDKRNGSGSNGPPRIGLTDEAKDFLKKFIFVVSVLLFGYLAVKTVLEHGLPISRKDSVNIVVKNGNEDKNNKERKNGNKKK